MTKPCECERSPNDHRNTADEYDDHGECVIFCTVCGGTVESYSTPPAIDDRRENVSRREEPEQRR